MAAASDGAVGLEHAFDYNVDLKPPAQFGRGPYGHRYRWLTQTLFIGRGRLRAGPGVAYEIYRVL